MAIAGPAEPQDGSGLNAAMMGPRYSGSITSSGFAIPLPPGSWVVLARSTVKTPNASGMSYYLGKIENKKLIGAVKFFVLRSIITPGYGFPEANLCEHINQFTSYVVVEGAISPNTHQSCWFIDNVYSAGYSYWADRAIKMNSLERAVGGDLAAKGVSYPQDLLEVRFLRSDASGYIEADYMFSPEHDGVTSHVVPSVYDSDWTATNIKRYPEKLAYLAKTKVWSETFWPRLKAAFSQGMGSGEP